MNFIYVFIYLYDVWCRDMDKKLKYKFISRIYSEIRLKFEFLFFLIFFVIEIVRLLLSFVNKGSVFFFF